MVGPILVKKTAVLQMMMIGIAARLDVDKDDTFQCQSFPMQLLTLFGMYSASNNVLPVGWLGWCARSLP